MSSSYYIQPPIPLSEVVDGRLQKAGIEVLLDRKGYAFFDGANWVRVYSVDGWMKGLDTDTWDRAGQVLDAISEIWNVVAFSDSDQPFEVVAAPTKAAAVAAQTESDECWFRQDWQRELKNQPDLVPEVARALRGEPVSMKLGGSFARIAGMAKRIEQEQPERSWPTKLLVDEAVERLIAENVETKRREREAYHATDHSDLRPALRARLGLERAPVLKPREFKGDFHFFNFSGPSTVCVYVTNEEEQEKWATVVDAGAADIGWSAFEAAIVQFIWSTGLMSGSPDDYSIAVHPDEYRAIAKGMAEAPVPDRRLLYQLLGRTRKRLEAEWTQREDRVWVPKETEAALLR